ncbi:MAG: hypothetical protein JWR69_1222 [Pedosphaera sp.]|nr:hypothetical protein [Pedosphaera sp.]
MQLSKLKKRLFAVLSIAGVLVALSVYYVKAHPLVFNESFLEHAHCIVQAGMSLGNYAADHEGRFPYHTNGYGDALLLLTDTWLPSLTGPGYSAEPFERASKTGQHLLEVECGRVYVQGLSGTNNPEIALLFDKAPTPGGDHCHLLARLTRPLCREVWTIGSDHRTIQESKWPEYARRRSSCWWRMGCHARKPSNVIRRTAGDRVRHGASPLRT